MPEHPTIIGDWFAMNTYEARHLGRLTLAAAASQLRPGDDLIVDNGHGRSSTFRVVAPTVDSGDGSVKAELRNTDGGVFTWKVYLS